MRVAFEDKSAPNVSMDTSRSEEPSIRNVADYRNGIKRALTRDTSHFRSTRDPPGSTVPFPTDDGRSDGATSGWQSRCPSNSSRATSCPAGYTSEASKYSRSATPRGLFSPKRGSHDLEIPRPSAMKKPKADSSVKSEDDESHIESRDDSVVDDQANPNFESQKPAENTEKPAEEPDTPKPSHSRWSSFRNTASKYTIGTLGVTGGLGFVYSTVLPSTFRSTIASGCSSAFRSVCSGISSAWNNPSSVPSNATGAFSSMLASACSKVGTGVSYLASATGKLPWWAQTALGTLALAGTATAATTGYKRWTKGRSTDAAKTDPETKGGEPTKQGDTLADGSKGGESIVGETVVDSHPEEIESNAGDPEV